MKQFIRFRRLPGVRIGVSEKASRPVEVVPRFLLHHALQVGDRRIKIAELHFAHAPPVKRIRRIGSRRNRAVIAGPRLREISVFHVQVGQFLVVSRGRVVEHGRLQFMDALASRKDLERLAQQSQIGKRLHHQVNRRAQRPQEENDVEPISIRASPNKVNDRQSYQKEAIGIQQCTENSHARAAI